MASVEHDSILPRTVSDSIDINSVQILIDLTSSDSRYCSSHSLGSNRVLLVKIPNVSSHSTRAIMSMDRLKIAPWILYKHVHGDYSILLCMYSTF